MKIIGTSNFDIETVNDRLVCERVSAYDGNFLVEMLNSREGETGIYFYTLVPDDYELYVWEP